MRNISKEPRNASNLIQKGRYNEQQRDAIKENLPACSEFSYQLHDFGLMWSMKITMSMNASNSAPHIILLTERYFMGTKHLLLDPCLLSCARYFNEEDHGRKRLCNGSTALLKRK